MTWHLKDRELEKKFIAIDSNFCVRLHNTCEREFRDKKDENQQVDVLFSSDKHLLGRLYFKRKMLEHIPEYDPNRWNPYPEVTPPEGILMRVETDRFRDCAIFKDGYWHSELFGEPNGRFPAEVECFRPWED